LINWTAKVTSGPIIVAPNELMSRRFSVTLDDLPAS
jgi:hypothetical protein